MTDPKPYQDLTAISDVQQHPDYHQGFYDAQDGEPIWMDECSSEYRAGWLGYWTALTEGRKNTQEIHDELMAEIGRQWAALQSMVDAAEHCGDGDAPVVVRARDALSAAPPEAR